MDFRVAPQAESDLDDIWYFLATQSSSIDVADRVVDSITVRFALLARQPYIGRRRDEDLRPGVRSFVVGDYVIAYRVDGDKCPDPAGAARQSRHRGAVPRIDRRRVMGSDALFDHVLEVWLSGLYAHVLTTK